MNSTDIMYGVRNAAGEWLCFSENTPDKPYYWDTRASYASWHPTQEWARIYMSQAKNRGLMEKARIVTVKVVET